MSTESWHVNDWNIGIILRSTNVFLNHEIKGSIHACRQCRSQWLWSLQGCPWTLGNGGQFYKTWTSFCGNSPVIRLKKSHWPVCPGSASLGTLDISNEGMAGLVQVKPHSKEHLIHFYHSLEREQWLLWFFQNGGPHKLCIRAAALCQLH